MKYIPEKHVLIDFLYGNLAGEEKQKVTQYLDENPEVKNELLGLKQMRETLGKYQDREVIIPERFDIADSHYKRSVPYLKTIVGVAAAILLILLVGYMTNLKVTYSGNQFTMQFGEPEKSETTTPSMEEIESLIVAALNKNKPQALNYDSVKAELIKWTTAMDQKRAIEFQAKLNSLAEEEKQIMQNYAQEVRANNTLLMDQYFQTAALQQRAYVEDVLVDFTKYMDEQRLQDRQFYLNNLVNLKYETDIQQQETEQMLTSIMNKVSNRPNENETQNF